MYYLIQNSLISSSHISTLDQFIWNLKATAIIWTEIFGNYIRSLSLMCDIKNNTICPCDICNEKTQTSRLLTFCNEV